MWNAISPVRAGPDRVGGRFRNPWPGAGRHGSLGAFLRWVLFERPRDRRRHLTTRETFAATHPPGTSSFPSPRAAPEEAVITWVGHSTFLLQIGGRNILTDPIWSLRASPVQWSGPRRWAPPGIAFDALPPIDAVLISHDHYDHLDRTTVERLAARDPHARWYCPLGVGAWLRSRGVLGAVECTWWDRVAWHDARGAPPATVSCTPARHFSGRRPYGRDETLWCGWVVRVGAHAIFFAGDTGRHPEFRMISDELGPFDAVLMPIGAYDPRWFMGAVHLDPVEAVAAYGEVADAHPEAAAQPLMVAMHWGTFQLTDEPMSEPPELTRAAWAAAGRGGDALWIPRHGETRRIATRSSLP